MELRRWRRLATTTSRVRASGRARLAMATIGSTTIRSMCLRIVQLHRGVAGVNALLGERRHAYKSREDRGVSRPRTASTRLS